MREEVLSSFRSSVRGILCKHLNLTAEKLIEITNDISRAAAPAIDQEVQAVVQTCGLIPEDHGRGGRGRRSPVVPGCLPGRGHLG